MIGGKNFNIDIDNNYYIFDALFEKDEIKFPVTLCLNIILNLLL